MATRQALTIAVRQRRVEKQVYAKPSSPLPHRVSSTVHTSLEVNLDDPPPPPPAPPQDRGRVGFLAGTKADLTPAFTLSPVLYLP